MKQDSNVKYAPRKDEGVTAMKGIIVGFVLGSALWALGGFAVYLLFVR